MTLVKRHQSVIFRFALSTPLRIMDTQTSLLPRYVASIETANDREHVYHISTGEFTPQKGCTPHLAGWIHVQILVVECAELDGTIANITWSQYPTVPIRASIVYGFLERPAFTHLSSCFRACLFIVPATGACFVKREGHRQDTTPLQFQRPPRC